MLVLFFCFVFVQTGTFPFMEIEMINDEEGYVSLNQIQLRKLKFCHAQIISTHIPLFFSPSTILFFPPLTHSQKATCRRSTSHMNLKPARLFWATILKKMLDCHLHFCVKSIFSLHPSFIVISFSCE